MMTGLLDKHLSERSVSSCHLTDFKQQILMYSCILFQRAARGSRLFSNMADILTEVMHLYSTGGLTCYSRIRDNE